MKPKILPPLSQELLDQLVFGMENQDTDMLLDTQAGMVVSQTEMDETEIEEACSNGERFIPLPDWSPANGFNLMEAFVGKVHNPICRKQLRTALDSGRGVFRKFKEVLSEYPPIREDWHRYKEQRLRAEAAAWYERECGAVELSDLDELYEETETADLTMSDIVITEANLDSAHVYGLLRNSLMENLAQDKGLAELLLARYDTSAARGKSPSGSEFSPNEKTLLCSVLQLCYQAKGPEGQEAGLVSGYICHSGSSLIAVCQLLLVEEAWRGLGLGNALLERFIAEATKRGAVQILLELAGYAQDLDGVLSKRGFEPISTLYSMRTQTPK